MNLWTALISGGAGAIIALLGVIIDQFFTSRRETRRWSREDQLRFTDHKRELYAEFLTQVDRWHREMLDIQNMQNAFGKKSDPERWGKWINTTGTNERQEVDLLLGRFRLVSHFAWERAQEHVKTLDALTQRVYCDELVVPDHLGEARVAENLLALTDSLRTDLTPLRTPGHVGSATFPGGTRTSLRGPYR